MILLAPEVTDEAKEVPASLEQLQLRLFASIISVQEEKKKQTQKKNTKQTCACIMYIYTAITATVFVLQ